MPNTESSLPVTLRPVWASELRFSNPLQCAVAPSASAISRPILALLHCKWRLTCAFAGIACDGISCITRAKHDSSDFLQVRSGVESPRIMHNVADHRPTAFASVSQPPTHPGESHLVI
jgi:hypothetical protein